MTKTNKKVIISMISIIILCLVLVISKSYSLTKKHSNNVLKTNGSYISFTINGTPSNNSFPSKNSGLVANSVTCLNGTTAEWDDDKWGLVNIVSNNKNKVNCNVDFKNKTLEVTLDSGKGNILDGYEMLNNSCSSFTNNGNNSYTITTTTGSSGMYADTSILEANKTYILRFNIQKTAGTLSNIGGHFTSSSQIYYKIDGVDASSPYLFTTAAGSPTITNITDDTNVHTIEYKFKFIPSPASGANNNMYIQPNRGLSASVTVDITNLELIEEPETIEEECNTKYSNLPTPTRTGYTFAGWSRNLTDLTYTDNYTFSSFHDRTSLEFKTGETIDSMSNQNYFRINGYQDSNNIDTTWMLVSKNTFNIKSNTQYLISMYIRANNSVSSQYMNSLYGTQGYNGFKLSNGSLQMINENVTFDNDGNWHLIHLNITMPNNSDGSVNLSLGNDIPNTFGIGSYIDIANIQVTEGTEYTPYIIDNNTNVTLLDNHTLYAKWIKN